MDVELELRIHERRDDRVVVALRVRPTGEAVAIDGAALHLVDVAGDEVCPQILLPLAGTMAAPTCMTVELRATRSLPRGCRVVMLAWHGADQATVTCPADPDVSLAEFVRGARQVMPEGASTDLFTVDDAQRACLEACWPWVALPTRLAEPTAVLEAGSATPDAATLSEDLGLCPEDAAWLEELLHDADS